MQIWIDHIGILSLIRLVFLKDFYHCKSLKYFSGSKVWVHIIKLVNPNILSTVKVDISAGDTHDAEGKSIRHILELKLGETLESIRNIISTKHSKLFAKKFPDTPSEWVLRFFCLRAYTKLRPDLAIIMTYNSLCSNTTNSRLLISKRTFTPQLLKCLDSSSGITTYGSLHLFITSIFLFTFQITILILSFLSSFIFGTTHSTSNRQRVGIQYCWGHKSNKRNDIYWLKDSTINSQDVVFYFDRLDYLPSNEITSDLKSRNIDYIIRIDLLRWAANLIKSPQRIISTIPFFINAWRPSRRKCINYLLSIYETFSILFTKHTFSAPICSLWAATTYSRLLFETNYWIDFFASNEIKVHMNHSGDCDTRHVIQTIALHSTKGANVRSNYSYTSFYDAHFSREFHAYFTWGPDCHCKDNIENNFSLYLISTGYIFDYIFSASQKSKGKQIIVAAFDEPSCGICIYSDETVFNFYDTIIRLSQNENIQFIIKSKSYNKSSLAKLLNTNNDKHFNSITFLPNELSPCNAAEMADLCICQGYNSAGIEAALSGCPTVYWAHDAHRCPQLDSPDGNRVFYSLEALSEAIMRAAHDKETLATLGNHDDIFDAIDPFRDGKAYSRVGAFVSYLLEGFALQYNSFEATRHASTRYSERFGSTHVKKHLS